MQYHFQEKTCKPFARKKMNHKSTVNRNIHRFKKTIDRFTLDTLCLTSMIISKVYQLDVLNKLVKSSLSCKSVRSTLCTVHSLCKIMVKIEHSVNRTIRL